MEDVFDTNFAARENSIIPYTIKICKYGIFVIGCGWIAKSITIIVNIDIRNIVFFNN